MNIRIAILIVGFAAVGCTKHNPAVCCNTPTQCSSFGLDGVTGCDTGKVCDSDGACISPQCASSAECANATPYCSSAGLCEMACTTDSECPGGGQTANQIHCSGGACVECADAADCPATAPVCASSACRICQQNSECASEVCATDGTCVAADMIAYVDSAGSDGADCSQATPCSLSHGTSLGRTYTVMAPGTYQVTQAVTLAGTRWLIGNGAQPSVSRTTPGPIVSIGGASHVQISNVLFSGAKNTSATSYDGSAIQCASVTSTLDLTDVVATGNAYFGVDASSCGVTATRSAFTHNGDSGIFVLDNPATFDRCDFYRNGGDGLAFDGTLLQATNSFFTGNTRNGAIVSTQTVGGKIEFSTAAGNVKNGIEIGLPASVSFQLSNDLAAGNVMNPVECDGGTCPQPGSIVMGMDSSTAHFVSGFDFHITAGSVAIDAAAGGTLDHDFDGDVRPKGAARDVGADEAQ